MPSKSLDYYRNKKPYGINSARMQCILDLISESHLEILDIGCSNGELAAELQKRGHTVDGIDISAQALDHARPNLRAGYSFDITSDEWPLELRHKKYDTIIISEVIEHLFEPSELMRKALLLLRDRGCMVVTTPNVLFWKNRLKMFFGSFEYQKEGIMDYGHIRFFTILTAREFFKKAGLRIDREHHFYPNLYRRGLHDIGRWFPGLLAYQMIFRVSRYE